MCTGLVEYAAIESLVANGCFNLLKNHDAVLLFRVVVDDAEFRLSVAV